MSRPQEPHRPFFAFGNPFRMILPKGSYLSPRLLTLLNTFEETLAERLRKLKPNDREDVLSLSWMRFAMESLSATHADIKALITALELPVCDWDEKWIDVYLDNSVKLLDICIGFSSELSRLNQGHLFLQCVLHNLDSVSSERFMKARSSLDGWKQHISLKNSRIDNCFTILDKLAETLNVPKVKNSSKGKVLMRAMYGVKVVTLFVCSIFAASFSGSAKKLMDLQVPETCLWAEAFTGMQRFVNGEIRNIISSGGVTVLKELEAVDVSVKKLYPLVEDGLSPVKAEEFQNCVSDLRKSTNKLSEGLDVLMKEVDGFFQIVLTGRDALLCNLRVDTNVSEPMQENINSEQVVSAMYKVYSLYCLANVLAYTSILLRLCAVSDSFNIYKLFAKKQLSWTIILTVERRKMKMLVTCFSWLPYWHCPFKIMVYIKRMKLVASMAAGATLSSPNGESTAIGHWNFKLEYFLVDFVVVELH